MAVIPPRQRETIPPGLNALYTSCILAQAKQDPAMFPKNAWYVAATPDEIDEKPLGRTICNENIVIYRPAAGQVAALEDFCPHRGAPLSLGTVCEGQLVCGYHGLAMG